MAGIHTHRIVAPLIGAVFLGASTLALSEDTLPFVSIDCGAGCAQVFGDVGLVSAPPGAMFIITLAHLPPAPEEALRDGNPVACEPINARIDRLSAKAGARVLEIQLGERNKIDAGRAVQIVHTVNEGQTSPPAELDRIGFQLRSEQPSAPCDLVASALRYDDPGGTGTPRALSLMTNVLPQFVFASGFEVSP